MRVLSSFPVATVRHDAAPVQGIEGGRSSGVNDEPRERGTLERILRVLGGKYTPKKPV